MNTIRDLLFAGNLEGLASIFTDHPELASQAKSLPDKPAMAVASYLRCSLCRPCPGGDGRANSEAVYE